MYGASKTDRHTIEAPGRVRRLTAAIVVNDRLTQMASKGKAAVWQPRSSDEIRNLTTLAQAAVGFDSSRGDMLTVEDLAFDGNSTQQVTPALTKVLDTVESSPVLVKYVALLAGLFGCPGTWSAPGAAPRFAYTQAQERKGRRDEGIDFWSGDGRRRHSNHWKQSKWTLHVCVIRRYSIR